MARIRQSTDLKTWPVYYLHPVTHQVISADFSWDTFTYYKYMMDVSRPQDHHILRGGVNACFHETWTYTGSMYRDWVGDYGYLVGMSDAGPYAVPPLLDTVALLAMLPTISDGDRNNAIMDAFNAFTDVWPEELSLGETTQGLLDLKSMIPKFSGDFVTDLASLHLNKAFAWDSLLSDIQAFSGLLSNVEKRIAFLRKTYGRPTTLRYQKTLETTLSGDIIFIEPVRSWGVKYILRSHHHMFYATSKLRQLVGHLDDAIGYLRGLVGALGGSNPLKQVWNLIPLSFVVDYFFNISARLDVLTRLRPVDIWELSNATHTFKEVARWEIVQSNNGQWGGAQQADQPLGTLLMTRYDRRLGLPFDVLNFGVGSLSPGQLGLLSALAAGIKHR